MQIITHSEFIEETNEDGNIVSYRQPMVIRCGCGARLELDSSWANECACGLEYNGSGQQLAPREQWGEETGETISDFHNM